MQKNFHAILQTCYLDNMQTSSMKLCGMGSVGSMGSMEVLMQVSCGEKACEKAFLPGNHFLALHM
jgi:hypothetical protein